MKKEALNTNVSTNYVNLERLTFLVDGVFAITLTLLVLELRPPESITTSLANGLLAMLPRLYIYLIAFYSIANHWVVHQRMFRHITSADTTMLWLTILGLLFITLIPASTAIVGRFPNEELAVACFSANSFLQALTNWTFGWLISILFGFVSVYIAYASWILWPNLVAVWGNHKRRILPSIDERAQHGKTKDKKQEVTP